MWGQNDFGQLGLGAKITCAKTPTEIPQLKTKKLTKVFCGYDTTFAVMVRDCTLIFSSLKKNDREFFESIKCGGIVCLFCGVLCLVRRVHRHTGLHNLCWGLIPIDARVFFSRIIISKLDQVIVLVMGVAARLTSLVNARF